MTGEKILNIFKKNRIKPDLVFLYSGRALICIDNLMVSCERVSDPQKRYFKVYKGIGVQYRGNPDAGSLEKIEMIGNILSNLKIDERFQYLYIDEKYRLDPHQSQEIFPFISFESKGKESELLIRYTYRCNQNCEFCSAPLLSEEPDEDILKMLIQRFERDYKPAVITFTGGEPALRRGLGRFIRWVLKNTEDSIVRIQTNAVPFSSPKLLEEILESKRVQFFVSLHSLNEREYDIITSSKGQMKRAIAGLQNIISKGFYTIVNIVINRYNYKEMDSYIESLHKYFGSRFGIHLSVLILPEYRRNLEDYIVSYREVVKYLLPVMKKYRIPVDSLVSSTHASIPLCYLPEELRKSVRKDYIPNDMEVGYEDLSKRWIKNNSCKKCKYDRYCIGVPNLYYRKFGIK